MKKTIIFIFIFLLTTLYISDVLAIEKDSFNKTGVLITTENKLKLKNLGFTDFEIDYMNQDEYDNNITLTGNVLSQTTKYYKTINFIPSQSTILLNKVLSITEEVTKEEYENSADDELILRGLTDGVTSTEYKLMTTTIIDVGDNYRYKNTLHWKKIPAVKSYDIIAIGIESDKVYGVSNSKYQRTVLAYETPTYSSYEETIGGTWTLSSTGYAVKFKIPYSAAAPYTVTALNTYMYFNVAKQNNNTIYVLNAYGDYSHAINNIPSNASISFGVNILGISIGVSYSSSYDQISTAQATLTGINW